MGLTATFAGDLGRATCSGPTVEVVEGCLGSEVQVHVEMGGSVRRRLGPFPRATLAWHAMVLSAFRPGGERALGGVSHGWVGRVR
jgi:hypothetical protein